MHGSKKKTTKNPKTKRLHRCMNGGVIFPSLENGAIMITRVLDTTETPHPQNTIQTDKA